MKWIKDKLVSNKIISGTWLSSGSDIVAELQVLQDLTGF